MLLSPLLFKVAAVILRRCCVFRKPDSSSLLCCFVIQSSYVHSLTVFFLRRDLLWDIPRASEDGRALKMLSSLLSLPLSDLNSCQHRRWHQCDTSSSSSKHVQFVCLLMSLLLECQELSVLKVEKTHWKLKTT